MEQTSEEHIAEDCAVNISNTEVQEVEEKLEEYETNGEQNNNIEKKEVCDVGHNGSEQEIQRTSDEEKSEENIKVNDDHNLPVSNLPNTPEVKSENELLRSEVKDLRSFKEELSDNVIKVEKETSASSIHVNNIDEDQKKDEENESFDVKIEENVKKFKNLDDLTENSSNSEVVIEDCIEESITENKNIEDKNNVNSIEETSCSISLQTENIGKQIENLNISVIPEKCNIRELQDENNKIKIRKTDKIIENEKENQFDVETPTRAHLQKIFTPAEEDAPPSKNRKNFASSAFYSPNHPTVEDQVNLARRISHSLSDISNQQSKGQTMYVNRKKRSVKWVHESNEGQSECFDEKEEVQENIPNNFPLKVVMNPRGKVRDLSSLSSDELISDTGLLSPTKCKELVSALNESSGRGAELFAKRRKRAEKWAAEDQDFQDQSVLTGLSQANTQSQYEKYYAENESSGYDKNDFSGYNKKAEVHQLIPSSVRVEPVKPQFPPQLKGREYIDNASNKTNQTFNPPYQPSAPLKQRDLAYKPNIAQGWNSNPINIPFELYVPKEIPLESYKAPPKAETFMPKMLNMKSVTNNCPWMQKTENLPVNNNSYSNDSWIQQAETPPQRQAYSNVSYQPIKSPWHENEKIARQQNNAQTQQFYTPTELITPLHQYEPMSSQYFSQYPTQTPPRQRYNFSKIDSQNFNTAARGWNGSRMGHCYKPITFGQQSRPGCMQYTDF